MAMITLTIRDTTDAGGRGFLFHVRADDRVIAANRSLSPAAAEAVWRLTREYLALFEQPSRLPQALQAELDRIGGALFSLWFGELWSQLPALPPGAPERLLVVESSLSIGFEYLASIGAQYPATLLVVDPVVQEVHGQDMRVPRSAFIADAAARVGGSGGQERFLNRQLSFPVSRMSQ